MADLSEMCSFAMMRINALLDEELDEQTADAVRAHIADCSNCLDEIEIWVSIRSAVKRAYPPDNAPPTLIERVTLQIRHLRTDS